MMITPTNYGYYDLVITESSDDDAINDEDLEFYVCF